MRVFIFPVSTHVIFYRRIKPEGYEAKFEVYKSPYRGDQTYELDRVSKWESRDPLFPDGWGGDYIEGMFDFDADAEAVWTSLRYCGDDWEPYRRPKDPLEWVRQTLKNKKLVTDDWDYRGLVAEHFMAFVDDPDLYYFMSY